MDKNNKGIIALVMPEIAVTNDLKTFVGGLATYDQTIEQAAYKAELPMVGFTILPREGYYDQVLAEDGSGMKVEFKKRWYPEILEQTGIKIQVSIGGSIEREGRPVWVDVLRLPKGRFGLVETYFFDTDIPENDYLSRLITLQLYGGSCAYSGANIDRKITQSLILGKATIKLIEHLELRVRMYHLNESHVIFTAVELLHEFIKSGLPFAEALEKTREIVRFTTHTILDNGNPRYSYERVAFLGEYSIEMLRQIGGEKDSFFTTAAGIFLSGRSNAVSKRHVEKVKDLFGKYTDTSRPLIPITNGTSQDFWQPKEFREASNPLHLSTVKHEGRRELRKFLETRDIHIDEKIMIVSWARRFEEYKRPKLPFFDMNWLKEKLYSNTFALIYAGKPHPDNKPMTDVWNYIYGFSKQLSNLYILPGFDLEMNKILKIGSDVWLNTPRAPYEACGTSGMSAAMCGTLHASIPDGWVLGANPENCFIFGSRGIQDGDQDWYDSSEMRTCFDSRIIPLFYHDKKEWYRKAFAAKVEAEKDWTGDRMLQDYIKLLYI